MARTTDTDRLLADVAALADPVGILSVYVGVLPEEASPAPRQQIELRHELDAAVARLAGDPARSAALAERLRELDGELEALASPREPGRGRALFAGLSGGEPVRAAFTTPFPTLATVGERAHVRPLAAAYEVARPAGIVLVSVEGLRVLEWRPGHAVELGHVEIADEELGRELRGPAVAHPKSAPFEAKGARSGGQRDLFERHVLLHREHRAAEEAPSLAALARERGWDEIVLAGDERMLRPLEEGIGTTGPALVVDHRLLGWLEPAGLAEAVAAPVADARSRRRAALCTLIRDEAVTGKRGALGVADTLAALEEGRVERLVLAAEEPLELAGLPGAAPGAPDLGDAMIARAFAIDATVTIVPSTERATLGADPAAALLRW